jgi:hypothetical protein
LEGNLFIAAKVTNQFWFWVLIYAKGFEDNRWLGILDVFIVKEEGTSVIWIHKSA